MAGEVTAKPWRSGAKNRWEVYVPAQLMPDGGRTGADRRVVTAYSVTEALAWGKERRRSSSSSTGSTNVKRWRRGSRA